MNLSLIGGPATRKLKSPTPQSSVLPGIQQTRLFVLRVVLLSRGWDASHRHRCIEASNHQVQRLSGSALAVIFTIFFCDYVVNVKDETYQRCWIEP
ncbi:hypothetical protein B0T19DRAFT_386729, partial [Cercophora scortea]